MVCEHLLFLLETRRIYWRQRSTARWVCFGDENTKFFHSFATRSYRRNFISQLKVDDDLIVTDHDLKAGLLFSSFKERLGCSEFVDMVFDLDAFIAPVALPVMDEPFSAEEIQEALKGIACHPCSRARWV